MNFLEKLYNPALHLCWNCGKEIEVGETLNFVNGEIWCDECLNGRVKCYIPGDRDE